MGGEKKPFACCRFAQPDANQRRPNRVAGSSRCDTTERPRHRASAGVEKSLSGRRSLTEFHLEDLQPISVRVPIGRKSCGGEPRGRQRVPKLPPFRCSLAANASTPTGRFPHTLPFACSPSDIRHCQQPRHTAGGRNFKRIEVTEWKNNEVEREEEKKKVPEVRQIKRRRESFFLRQSCVTLIYR